jgi:thiol:disulfide interchange protein DsbD
MRAFLFLVTALISLNISAQIYSPVKWSITLTPAGDGNYLLQAKANIDKGWWVYSQHLDSDDGPIATTLVYDEGSHFKLVGKNKESDNVKKVFDKFFEMNVNKFTASYTIEQKIKVSDPSKPISGYLNFMTCNDDRCLPPVDVEFELKATGGSTGDAGTTPSDHKSTASTTSAQDPKSTVDKPKVDVSTAPEKKKAR